MLYRLFNKIKFFFNSMIFNKKPSVTQTPVIPQVPTSVTFYIVSEDIRKLRNQSNAIQNRINKAILVQDELLRRRSELFENRLQKIRDDQQEIEGMLEIPFSI